MYKNFFIKTVLFLSFTLLGLGCTQSGSHPDDPKKVLTDYVSRSFSVKSIEDRGVLAGYLTGDAKARLAGWSDDQFKEAFIDHKREFNRLLIRELTRPSKTETHITYEISFSDKDKGKDVRVTNLKIGTLIKENERWYISEVKNIKELVEYKNEMSLP